MITQHFTFLCLEGDARKSFDITEQFGQVEIIQTITNYVKVGENAATEQKQTDSITMSKKDSVSLMLALQKINF